MLNYSIHTYELYTLITNKQFWQIYNTLAGIDISIEKKETEATSHAIETLTYTFRKTPYYGINSITIKKIEKNCIPLKCTLHIVINPYNALHKQLYSDEHIISSSKINAAVQEINTQLHCFLNNDICNSLIPYRIDFCVNLPFPTQEQALEYIKLLRIGVPPKRLVEFTQYSETQKRATPYPDSLLLTCKSYSLEIYSKHNQMKNHNVIKSKNSANGIVRIELRASHTKLKSISKKYHRNLYTSNYATSLSDISFISQSVLKDVLSKMVGTGDFLSHSDAVKKIESGKLHASVKNNLLLLLIVFSKKQKGIITPKDLGITHKEWQITLDRFNTLGCSPITVPKSFSLSQFPGINSWNTYF